MLREADIAYIAGLFDGEGSVTYKKYYETKIIVLIILFAGKM